MATKSTRKTVVTTTTAASSFQSPVPGTSTMPDIGLTSPLSPTRFSRLHEKVELQNLNDRLAVYIERVRNLESENNRLFLQVQTSQESVSREVNSVKSMYESELNDARKLLDETAKEKAKLQIEATKWKAEIEELQAKYTKKEKDCAAAERQVQLLDPRLQDLQSRLNQAVSDRKKAEDENKELKAENDRLTQALAKARNSLEEETLNRIDVENRLQSLKEELQFKSQLHEKEMTETRTRRHVEITEIDGRLQEQYEQKLADSLRELREQYEETMLRNREEIEQLYESKLGDLGRINDSAAASAATAREELRQTQTRLDVFTSKVNELEALNKSLQTRIKDLEKRIQDERDAQMALLAAKENELRTLQDLMTQQLQEYQDLMDIKVALDMEIAAYRKLLEGEEARLHITPGRAATVESETHRFTQRSTPIRRTPVRGAKRKRTMMEEEESSSSTFASTSSATGDVEIHEQDAEGKYIKLYNKGKKDVPIGGWQLMRKFGDQEVYYKFHRSIVIKSGTYTTVWSSNAGATHSAPSDLVMKGQRWLAGKEVSTVLLNADGEEVAQRLSAAQQRSVTAIYSRETLGGSSVAEQIFQQQGDPQDPDRCSLM